MIQIEHDVSLKRHNTFGIDIIAPSLLRIRHAKEIQDAINQDLTSDELIVLGGGSNILFTQQPRGLVIKNEIKGKEIIRENEHDVWLRVGAGENWHELVLFCLEHGWGGIENLSLIPGSVGAAPIQNIGAYGVEIKEVFVYLEAIDLMSGETHIFHRDFCGFGYRDSIFKQTYKGRFIITHVVLCLSKQPLINTSYKPVADAIIERKIDQPTIRDVSNIIIEIRKSKLPDPEVIGNAGSFFKNPIIARQHYEVITDKFPEAPHYPVDDATVKLPAAWLIQSCGWKGKKWDHYGVHEKQALVLVNYGGASGKELLDLSEKIQISVFDTFGIRLEREVNVI